MERELGGWGYLLHLLFVIYGNTMGIAAVAEAGECGRLVQKVETDGDILWLAACDGAYKPFCTFALGYYVVIASLAANTRVSSHVVGTEVMNRVHSCSRR